MKVSERLCRVSVTIAPSDLELSKKVIETGEVLEDKYKELKNKGEDLGKSMMLWCNGLVGLQSDSVSMLSVIVREMDVTVRWASFSRAVMFPHVAK